MAHLPQQVADPLDVSQSLSLVKEKVRRHQFLNFNRQVKGHPALKYKIQKDSVIISPKTTDICEEGLVAKFDNCFLVVSNCFCKISTIFVFL